MIGGADRGGLVYGLGRTTARWRAYFLSGYIASQPEKLTTMRCS